MLHKTALIQTSLMLTLFAEPLRAQDAQNAAAAQCAALWLGVLDAAEDYPALFQRTAAISALADSFATAAGPDAGPAIDRARPDFERMAKAKVVYDDPLSGRLFDRLAVRCNGAPQGRP